jgi:hypothetical protein
MSLTPAQDALDVRRKIEKVEKCGKNMGPHDYIPISWRNDPETMTEHVTRFMCRVCFVNIAIKELIERYPEVKF